MYEKNMTVNLLKSVLHNVGVVIVGFAFALLGMVIDSLFGISEFSSVYTIAVAWLLLALGFLLRVWATNHVYEQQMKAISLSPQRTLITAGPYRFTRNP